MDHMLCDHLYTCGTYTLCTVCARVHREMEGNDFNHGQCDSLLLLKMGTMGWILTNVARNVCV